MWAKVAEEIQVPWRTAEAMHCGPPSPLMAANGGRWPVPLPLVQGMHNDETRDRM